MLAVARRTAPEVSVGRRQSPSGSRLEADSIDVVVSQFAPMFVGDRELAVREMRRVLRPGGRVVLATWAELDASPGYAAHGRFLRRVVGDPPADALLPPFSVGTEAALRSLAEPVFPAVRRRNLGGDRPLPLPRGVAHHRRQGLDVGGH